MPEVKGHRKSSSRKGEGPKAPWFKVWKGEARKGLIN